MTTVPIRTVINDRLVSVALPQDSALIRMILSCDSMNNVLVTQLETVKSTGVQTSFKKESNVVEIRYKTVRDTAYLRVTDTVRQEPVVVEVEKKVNYLRWWQKALCVVGLLSILSIVASIYIKFILKK